MRNYLHIEADLAIDKLDGKTKKEVLKFIKQQIRSCGSDKGNVKITNVEIYGYRKNLLI